METASLTDMSDTSVQVCFPDYLDISQTSKDSGINICSFGHYPDLKPYKDIMEKNENVENIGARSSEGDINDNEILKWFLDNLQQEFKKLSLRAAQH